MAYGLRDYQEACHDAILAEWGHAPWWDGERATSRTTVANLATSAGKTIIAARLTHTLTEQLAARVLFVADREELIMQPVAKFHAACGIMAAVHRGQDRASAHADVVVASIQTLARRLPCGRPFTHIIDDEAHRNTDQRKKIHDAYPEARILGITATAFRKNMADLSKWYETVAYELGTFDLIDQGYITPIKVLTMPLEVDLTAVKQRSGDFDQDAVSAVLEPHYRAVARAIKEHAPARTILAFLPLIKSSVEFVSTLKQEGITAMHCDGGTPDRAQVIHAFEQGEFQVLSNSEVFSTGVDFIRCDCILNLAATRSRVEYRQRVGRGMRLLPGTIDPGGVTLATPEERRAAIAASEKPDMLILDLLWQTNTIGLAGPASIVAGSEEEEEFIDRQAKKQRSAEDLAAMREDFKRGKEEELRKALELAAKKQAEKAGRLATLRDALELILELHDQTLLEYVPAMPGEARRVGKWQKEKLERLGFDPDSIETTGHAAKLLDAVEGRQARGLVPIEAFAQLRTLGYEHPEQVTLSDGIRALGDRFPMTFGVKHRGKALRDVPKSFWAWLRMPESRTAFEAFERKHKAAFRYFSKVVYPAAPKAEQAPLPL